MGAASGMLEFLREGRSPHPRPLSDMKSIGDYSSTAHQPVTIHPLRILTPSLLINRSTIHPSTMGELSTASDHTWHLLFLSRTAGRITRIPQRERMMHLVGQTLFNEKNIGFPISHEDQYGGDQQQRVVGTCRPERLLNDATTRDRKDFLRRLAKRYREKECA